MKARLVVFPIKGRNWCFLRSIDASPVAGTVHCPSSAPPSLKVLWQKLISDGRSFQSNVELVVDFASNKMNRAWINLGNSPPGSVKNRIHDIGLRLLSKVKPSEVFLKSVSKDITKVDITYPASLNPRLVRQRIRHIALRGSIKHRRYLYASATLLPFTSLFTVLPLPNIPFFWLLYRVYSHWRALQGSERLLSLISDCPRKWSSLSNTEVHNAYCDKAVLHQSPWVLNPSERLDRFFIDKTSKVNLSDHAILSICQEHNLDKEGVLKYKDTL